MDNQPIRKKKAVCSLKHYRAISLILIAAAVLLRTLNLFLYYEADIGYYQHGAVLPFVLRALLLLATVLFAVLSFGADTLLSPKPHTAFSAVAITVGATFFVTALLRYCASATEITRPSIILFVTGGFAAVYFILLGLHKLSASAALITGFGTILWFGCILVSSYFDVYVQMNAPLKLALLLACLGGMLLMLAEMRHICAVQKKRFYLFALSASTLYLCTSAIPTLIADAAGLLPARDLAFADLPCLALGLFGVIRLLGPFGPEEEPKEDTPADEEAAPLCEEAEEVPDSTDTE